MKKHLRLRPFLPLFIGLFVVFGYGCEKEPLAEFTLSPESGYIYETITFTNTSQNASSYSWDFGDGSSSTEENPTYAYATAGTFTVTLTAKGGGVTSKATKTIEITIPPFNIVPGIRIGDFKLSDNFNTLKSFIPAGITGSHIVMGFGGGKYWHLLSYDKIGISFAFSNNSGTLSESAMPEQIYAYSPFKGSTEKGIMVESLLTDVAKAYGTPEQISSSYGHYYYKSLGINFFADDTKTKVSQITITIPGTKSESPFSVR